MIHIRAEGTEFDYLAVDQVAAGIKTAWEHAAANTLDLATGSDTRLALFQDMLDPSRRNPYWLVWQAPIDLIELDNRAQFGAIKDQDFRDCYRTVQHRTVCPSCKAVLSTLVIDDGDPYPGAPQLHRAKILRMKILRCPRCDSRLRQLVAKIIG